MARAKESASEETPLLAGHSNRPSAASEGPSPPTVGVNSEDLDARLKRWLDYIARRSPKKAVSALEMTPQFLISIFEKHSGDWEERSGQRNAQWEGFINDEDFAR